MKANKARAAVLFAFLIALGAGIVGGMLISRLPMLSTAAGAQPVTAQSPLTEMLQLSPDQSEKMRMIWQEAQGKAQTALAQVQALQKGRDDALVAILTTDEQRAKYEKVTKEYAKQFEEVIGQRDHVFQDAVEQTRQILSPQQQKKYEEVLRTRLGPKVPGKELLPSPVILPESEPLKSR
jgi:cell division protein ZapA (FtsZ GTPase activity inhibitor)